MKTVWIVTWFHWDHGESYQVFETHTKAINFAKGRADAKIYKAEEVAR